MPGPIQSQPVNFFAGANPSLYAEQQGLNQQQALAQQMMGDAMQPINPTRTAGRFVVPISPLEGASHAGKAIAAAMMQKNINNQQGNLANQQMQAMLQLLRGGQPQQASAGGTAQTNPMETGGASVMAPTGQPPQPQQRGPLSLTGDPNKDLGLMMAGQQLGPYGAALLKQYEPGAGIQNVRPGGTVYDTVNSRVLFNAPQLPPGSAPINPQNPAGGVQAIPGAQAVTGANAAAQSVGAAQGKTVEVELRDGRKIRVPESSIVGTGSTPATPGSAPTPAAEQSVPGSQGQTTFGKTFAEKSAASSDEYVNHLRTQAQDSVDQNRMLDELDSSIKDFGPGKAAAMRKAIAQWRVQAGVANDEDKKIAASAETGDKLVGQLVSNALKKLSARPTQMEFQIFKDQFVPNLAMTPQGAQQVMQFMRQQNNLSLLKYQEFNKWRRQQPTDTDFRDFDLSWNPKMATSPLGSSSSFPFQDVKRDGAANTPLSPAEQQELQQLRSRFGR